VAVTLAENLQLYLETRVYNRKTSV